MQNKSLVDSSQAVRRCYVGYTYYYLVLWTLVDGALDYVNLLVTTCHPVCNSIVLQAHPVNNVEREVNVSCRQAAKLAIFA